MNFEARIRRLLLELGIPDDFHLTTAMPMCEEASDLVQCENDMFGREQFMTPFTARCWGEMNEAAGADSVTLQLVSAFRSVDYQCNLIRRKIEGGQLIEQILKVNAAPGFSEHHTGRALDLSTPGCEPLSEEFETTDAFAWLTRNAARFNFTMSYPRDNPLGIIYEPWHWACRVD